MVPMDPRLSITSSYGIVFHGSNSDCGCVAVFPDGRDDECTCDQTPECSHYCIDHDQHHCPYNHPSTFLPGGSAEHNNHFTQSDAYYEEFERRQAFNEELGDDASFNPIIVCGNAVAAGLHRPEDGPVDGLLLDFSDSQWRERLRRVRSYERSALRQ